MREDAELRAESNDDAVEDPLAKFLRLWIGLRQRQGLTREAAVAELNSASSLVAGVDLAHD
jgi:hypothetical protein